MYEELSPVTGADAPPDDETESVKGLPEESPRTGVSIGDVPLLQENIDVPKETDAGPSRRSDEGEASGRPGAVSP